MRLSDTGRRTRTDGNPGSRHHGTRLAVYSYSKSGSLSDAEPVDVGEKRHAAAAAPVPDNTAGKQRRLGWGGARNRRDRTSNCLTLAQARNLLEAATFAAALGMPLNRHITIHWERAGVPDAAAARATGRFLKLAGDWLATLVGVGKQSMQIKTARGTFGYLWVRENGDGKGTHVHILCHVPAGVSLGKMQRRWLKLVTGRPYRARTIKTARIAGTTKAAETLTETYLANLTTVTQYILKGASPEAASVLQLGRLEAAGHIIGKRAATSRNIGLCARGR